MPYIKEPDFAKICAMIEDVEEIHNDISGPNTNASKRIITKVQNILKEYKK